VIESKHVHDFVMCSCGSCAADGGKACLRRCFKEEGCYTELSELEETDENETKEKRSL
jgi:hypothetical protein